MDARERWIQASLAISLLPANEFVTQKLVDHAYQYRHKLQDEIEANFGEFCTKARSAATGTKTFLCHVNKLESILSDASRNVDHHVKIK